MTSTTQSKPAKSHWIDLAVKDGEMGREDCQKGWHELASSLIPYTDTILDVGAGLAKSKSRLGEHRTTTQDPGPGLPVDRAEIVGNFPSKSYDYVTCFDVIEHVVYDIDFLDNLKRIARKGVFITTPNLDISKAVNGCHCREYSPAEFLKLTAGTGRRLWTGNGDGIQHTEISNDQFQRYQRMPHHAALLNVRESNLGRWDAWYKNKNGNVMIPYGRTDAYLLGAIFLTNVPDGTIEDWGCGLGYFRKFVPSERYLGIDGTKSPFSDVVCDLAYRMSHVPCIFMRGVIEHDWRWKQILQRAILSFQNRMCLVLFTPESDVTKQIAFNEELGVPDISFSPEDLKPLFEGLKVKKEYIKSSTAYGGETIYYLEKP